MSILQNNKDSATHREAVLSKRLIAAALYVIPGRKSVDVGTDHAYLPVYLYKKGITQSILACDINQKPLETARRTIKEAGLEGKIELRLSNGLEAVEKQEAQNIIICGMGGELILRILLSSPFLLNDEHNLILQPMTNAPFLRRGLYQNGFEILSETPVIEGQHFYTVMQAKRAKDKQGHEKSEEFWLVGKIPLSLSEDRDAYINHIIKKQEKIIDGLKKAKNVDVDFSCYEQTVGSLKKLLYGEEN